MYITIMEVNAAFVLMLTTVMLHVYYMGEYKTIPLCLSKTFKLKQEDSDSDSINPWHLLIAKLDAFAFFVTLTIVTFITIAFFGLMHT